MKVLVGVIGLCLFPIISIFPVQTQSVQIWENPPRKKTLSNGLTLLLYQKDKSSDVTVIQIFIKGGKRAEPEGKQGLAYLTTRLTLEIPDQRKIQDIMNQATRITMSSRGDYSIINIACLSENLKDALKLESGILLKPLFSGLRIDRVKKQMEHQRETQEDDPVNAAHNYLLENMFKNTGYAGSIYGSKESLKAIKKKDIKNFYDKYFRAGNMIVAVSTDLEEEFVFEMIKRYFEKIPPGEAPESGALSIPPLGKKNHFIEKETKQSLVSVAFPLPKITPRNYILAYMLENLLGKEVNSKLWPLRSKEKLAYNVNSIATQLKEGGILEAYLETDNTKKEIALDALKKVLKDLYDKGITEEELLVTKIYSKTFFMRNNETKETRTYSLGTFEILGLGYEFLNKIFQEIDATTLEEINSYIKNILDPEKGIEIVVGPNITQNSKLNK